VNSPLSRLIEVASVVDIDLAPLGHVNDEAAPTAAATLDRLSLEVASQYACGKMSFELADEIMNYVFAFAWTQSFLESNRNIPEISFAVYQAFDEGEYHRSKDQRSEHPEEKYTKPLVSELLRKYQNAA